MNFKKFISGVSAFAIAASAFAAMVVTANAQSYERTISPTDDAGLYNLTALTNNGDGTLSSTGTKAGGGAIDLSGLTDIGSATEVTVEFRTIVKSSGQQIMPVCFGIGDKAVRGLNCAGSTSSYNVSAGGLVALFGAQDTSTYYVHGDTTNNFASKAANNPVYVKATLDRVNHTYSVYYEIEGKNLHTTKTGSTTVDNLTVIEVYKKQYNLPISLYDITVSYTTPDAPAKSVVIDGQDPISGSDGNGVIVGATISGIDTIETLTITADGSTRQFTEGEDFDFKTSVSGSDVQIAVIVKNVSNVTAIAIN